MTSVLDKRVQVEGALKDDKVYNKEEKQIEEMMQRYPQLDFLMCLLLIQATSEELEEITKNPKPRQLDTSTIIKQDFYPEEQPNLNTLVIS